MGGEVDPAPEAVDGAFSPRVAGIAMMIASTAAGVLAAFFIPHPSWGIPAAILLAVASVGVGVGAGSLLIRRKSWADKTWPPGGAPAAADSVRARRAALAYGVFLLLASIAAGIGLFATRTDAEGGSVAAWVMIVTFALFGIALTAMGLRPVPKVVESAERPASAPNDESDGWVRLGPERPPSLIQSGMLALRDSGAVYWPASLIALIPFASQVSTWGGASILILIVVGAAIATVIARRRMRPPWVAEDGSAFRTGTTEIPASQITAASFTYAPWEKDATERSFTLIIEKTDKTRASVPLRRRGHLVLTERQTALFADLLSQSAIDLPRDKEDPTGRFSRVLYPTHLTRAQAIEIVTDPPGDHDPLPGSSHTI